MTYVKQRWHDDDTTPPFGPVNAERLGHMEDGISSASPAGMFNVQDEVYGATGDGATDDTAAFVAAHAAAVAAGGGVIYMPPGTYLLQTQTSSTASAVIAAPNLTGNIQWRGAGRGVTIILLKSPVSSFMSVLPDNTHPTYRGYEFTDFTLKGTNSSTTNKGYLLYYVSSATSDLQFDIGYHRVERVDSWEFGHTVTRGMIWWNLNRPSVTAANAGQTCYMRDLYMNDVQIGVPGHGNTTTQGGGITGVVVIGFIKTTGGDKDANGRFYPSLMYNLIANPANTVCDNINLSRVTQWSGQAPVNPNSLGAPFQIGGDGIVAHARLKDCIAKNTGDIGFEIDAGIDVDVDGCVVHNCDGNGFYAIPYGAGTGTQAADIRFRNCHVVWDRYDDNGDAIVGWSPVGAFVVDARFGSISKGRVLFENCESRMDSTWNGSFQPFQVGASRVSVVRDCRSVFTNSETTAAGALVICHLDITSPGIDSVVEVDGFHCVYDAPQDTSTFQDTAVRLAVSASTRLSIRNVTSWANTPASNSGLRNLRLVDFSCPKQSTVQEAFATDLLAASFVFDSGAATNYGSLSGGAYTAGANLSTENRAYYVATNTIVGFLGHIGAVQDGSHYTKMTTGASRTAYKGGAWGKRVAATTYLDGYVYDDGTDTYLCVDKVVAGVRTSLLGAVASTATGANSGGVMTVAAITSPPSYVSAKGIVLGTRLGTSSVHYPAITVQGDTVTAEHWVSAEPGNANTNPAGAGDAWIQVTLTGSDKTTFGSQSMLGEFGFSQVPIAAAKIAKPTHRRLSTVSGILENVKVLEQNTVNSTSVGFYCHPAFTTKIRLTAPLVIRDCDFTRLGPAGSTVTDFDLSVSNAFLARLNRSGIAYWSPPVGATITPSGSPYTYQNLDGYRERVSIDAGTVSAVSLVDLAGNSTLIASSTNRLVTLDPGESVTVTYTVAPTMAKVPIP